MPSTPNLSLPYLEAGQAQKHVTHNEALAALDALVQLAVAAVSDAPPAEPADGERHIVGASPSGAFAGHTNEVAAFQDGAWAFFAPRPGWRAWNADDEALLVWSGSAWDEISAGGGFDPEAVEYLYINGAEPEDEDAKLAVRAAEVLFHAVEAADSGTGDVRLQLSKEAAGDTASVFFSRDFSGRAEFGLVESDDFVLKVSDDGAAWTQALVADPATGKVRLPQNDVAEIVLLADQAAYDALDPPDADTLYLVPEEA
jgi:hypothetical protein